MAPMSTPISPPPVTSGGSDDLPAYVSNGLIGLRILDIPLLPGVTLVNGYSGLHPVVQVEAAAEAPYPLAGDLEIDGIWLTTAPHQAEFLDQGYDFATGELVRSNVDVIVASTSMPALAAKRATSTIPIVMVASADPVTVGLVASLARPGGNITGSAVLTPELSTKQLELLKEISPRLSRIPVILNSTNPVSPKIWRDLQQTAPGLAVALEYVDVREASGLIGFLGNVSWSDKGIAATAKLLLKDLSATVEDIAIQRVNTVLDFDSRRPRSEGSRLRRRSRRRTRERGWDTR